jgi:hypothetical protein
LHFEEKVVFLHMTQTNTNMTAAKIHFNKTLSFARIEDLGTWSSELIYRLLPGMITRQEKLEDSAIALNSTLQEILAQNPHLATEESLKLIEVTKKIIEQN